jgi:hypothetical protein
MDMKKSIHSLSTISLIGTAVFVLTTVALHIVQPELSPLDEAMSYYVHGAHGWLMSVALLAIGVGSLALAIGLAQVLHGQLARVGIGFLIVWAVGAILGGAFSADPPGNWDRPPSTSGAIHGIAAIVALTAFPLAAVLIALGAGRDREANRKSALLNVLSVASVVSFVAFAASLVPVMIRPGPPVLLGLTERVLLGVYAAWLAVVAVGLMRTKSATAN